MKTDDTFQVLVAEDEPIILDNIVKKVEKASPLIRVSGKAQNGQEALDILRDRTFDILITDIEMPGMSGLELIRQVKELYPDLKVVILSGYSNFEYARTALRYGVEDYLLKPLDQDILAELLSTLCRQIEDEKKTARRDILSFALNHASDSSAPPSLFQDSRLCLIYISLGNTFPAQSGVPSTSGRIFNELWEKLPFEDCFHSAQNVEHLWMIDEKSPAQKFLILHLADSRQTAEYFLLLLGNFLRDRLGSFPYTLLVYGTPVSYRELWEKAEFLRGMTRVCARCFSQTAAALTGQEQTVPESGPEMLEDMELLFSISDNARYIRYIQNTLPEAFSLPPSVFVRCVRMIYDSMAKVFQVNPRECSCAENAFLSTLPVTPSREICLQNLEASLRELWESTSAPVSGSGLARRVAHYIELNLKNQLSLPGLAEHFGYTASYINRIFKKEYGLSPLQYLTSLKPTRAKELLRKNPDINIRHVAEAVGYEDARYFSRIFKNETGMTPTAWAEKEKSGFAG